MSAGRSASTLLATLVATMLLFAVFVGISTADILERHAYTPGFGWNQPADKTPGNILHGVCASTAVTSGFPLAASRQAAPPDNCLKATNPLAQAMNYALYFAAAAIISVALVGSLGRFRV